MSEDTNYRKARAALREAQAQAQLAMSELRLTSESYDDLSEVLRLLHGVHTRLVMSIPSVHMHLALLDAANNAGMRPYVSIEDEGLKPGGMVASPGKSVIIDGGDEEYLIPVATLEWWQSRNREDFKVARFRSGLNDPEKFRITHTPTGHVTSAGDFWVAVSRMHGLRIAGADGQRASLEMEES